MKKKISAVVLAAGKSKRTKTTLPKVLLEVGGRPLIFYILEILSSLKVVSDIIVVLGHKKDLVKEFIAKEFKNVKFSFQKELNGTAKALLAAKPLLNKTNNVLVLCADSPLITAATLKECIKYFFKEDADCAVLTAIFKEKNDLGRITRDEKDKIKSITERVELKESGQEEEVNSGIYCFKRDTLFKGLKLIRLNKKKKEFFLTDIIEIFYHWGCKILGYKLKENTEILGVNTQKNLSIVRKVLNQRFLDNLMKRGVVIVDPENTFVSFDTKIGKNTVVYPFTFIEKNVIIGSNCTIGPFVRLRENTVIRDNVKLGNFLEINRSKIDEGTRIKHFGYLGDTTVGKSVNIGAGVVVANYDGKKKYKTFIKKKAFIGSDTIIVAPAKIGKGAVTGAGSVVTKNVKDKNIVVGVPARVLRKR